MGRAANNGETARPHEHALGRLLFDRYPHLVPSPTWVSSLHTLVGDLEDDPAWPPLATARPMRVLEAWFDCWAALALREPPRDDCSCAEPA